MPRAIKPIAKNILASSPHYIKILRKFNDTYEMNGRVNRKKFFLEVIKPLIPDYSLMAWYGFLQRYEHKVKLLLAEQLAEKAELKNELQTTAQENRLKDLMFSNEQATAMGINAALNAGAEFYRELMLKYKKGDKLTKFEEGCLKDALFKAMRSQDSRIHAIGKVREDNRQEEMMERAFDNAQYDG